MENHDDHGPAEPRPLTDGQRLLIRLLAAQAAADWLAGKLKPLEEPPEKL